MVSKIGRFRQPEKGSLLDGPGDQAVQEAKIVGLLERVAELLVTEALAEPLHAQVSTLKGPPGLIEPAGVVQKLPERDLGSPVLDRVSQRRRELQRRAQMLFAAIPIPLRALELAGESPALDEVLA